MESHQTTDPKVQNDVLQPARQSKNSELRDVLFVVHESLLPQQFFFSFHIILVRDTTIYWANSSTLRLFMEAHTLGALVWHDIIDLVTYRFLDYVRIDLITIGENDLTIEVSTVGITPIVCSFVDRGIWALGLASPAINAFVGDNDGHNFSFSANFAQI